MNTNRLVETWTAVILTLLLSIEALAEDLTGRVVGLSDGDTIRVILNGGAERIRLQGIDCPEMGQAFGSGAKQFTSSLVFGKRVKLRTKGQDRYGRTIADVILPDGRNLNHEIVRAGFGWWFRKYAPNDGELKRLEQEAREARRGLWVDRDPMPPWQWRRRSHAIHSRN